MADHVRKQLRDAVVTLLTGLSGTGTRVLPLEKDLARSILVRTPGDESRDSSQSGSQDRVVRLTVSICGKGSAETLPDEFDASAVLVEKAFAADMTIGGKAETYEYRGAELALDGSGEKTAGSLTLTFDVTVYTARATPDVVG